MGVCRQCYSVAQGTHSLARGLSRGTWRGECPYEVYRRSWLASGSDDRIGRSKFSPLALAAHSQHRCTDPKIERSHTMLLTSRASLQNLPHRGRWPIALIVAGVLLNGCGDHTVCSADIPTEEPEVIEVDGWRLGGSISGHSGVSLFRLIRDDKHRVEGGSSARLESHTDPGEDFGTIVQELDAAKFKGKRVRFAAALRTRDVAAWSGLWMRVGSGDNVLAFDNMQGRPVRGDTEWRRYSIVLDVPEAATRISFGALMVGAGKLWIDDASFGEVDESVPVTATAPVFTSQVFAKPRNLGFE
jgi:hypothetical protein